MNLGQQFQIIIFSFLFGIIFLASYDLFNRIFYKIKGKFVRFVLELIFFSLLSSFYFFILFAINDAVLTIYLPLLIILGALFYIKFLSFPLLIIYESIIKKIKNKIRPCFLSIKKYLIRIKINIKNCILKFKRKKHLSKTEDEHLSE